MARQAIKRAQTWKATTEKYKKENLATQQRIIRNDQ